MFPCPGPGADHEQLRVHEDGVQQQADHLQHALRRRPRQGRVSGGSLLQCCVMDASLLCAGGQRRPPGDPRPRPHPQLPHRRGVLGGGVRPARRPRGVRQVGGG